MAAGGETVLVDLPNLSSATNHNGGALHFGPDGKLYVAVGDNAHEQQLAEHDHPLREDAPLQRRRDHSDRQPVLRHHHRRQPRPSGRSASAIRSPSASSRAPAGCSSTTSAQSTWEEINDGLAGANYGWPAEEGSGGAPTYVDPVYAYGHSPTTPRWSSATPSSGAAFYGPASTLFPAEYQGNFFFADYVERVGQPAGHRERQRRVRLLELGLAHDRPAGRARWRAVRPRALGARGACIASGGRSAARQRAAGASDVAGVAARRPAP